MIYKKYQLKKNKIKINNNKKIKDQSWYKNQIKSSSKWYNWKKIQNKIYSNQNIEDGD
jgi:hypothetical protein